MSPTPLHTLFPEFEHVFSGMEIAVLALLRHWHPWRTKEKLKHSNEAWGWTFLSHSFICWWCMCVVQGRYNEYCKSKTGFESRYSHREKYLYSFSMSLLLNQKLRDSRYSLVAKETHLYLRKHIIILLESSKNWTHCIDLMSLLGLLWCFWILCCILNPYCSYWHKTLLGKLFFRWQWLLA